MKLFVVFLAIDSILLTAGTSFPSETGYYEARQYEVTPLPLFVSPSSSTYHLFLEEVQSPIGRPVVIA